MSQNLTFDRWILYGSGFTQSYQAKATITVSRSYGSDTASVSVSASMSSYGGDTNTNWICYVKIGSTWYNWTISSGSTTHWANEWYSSSNSWNISVGATAGSLSGQVYFRAYDTGASVGANSSAKDWSQSYGTKGASTITSATNVTVNGSNYTTVKFTSYSSSFRHKVVAKIGSTTIATGSLVNGANNSEVTTTLTIPLNALNYITNSKTATCVLTLTTYSDSSGSTSIGSSTKNITLTCPNNINPSVSISTAKVSALSSTYFSGKYCTLIDKMQVTLSASALYSATISSRSITANGESFTASPSTTSALKTVGANTISASVIDSRGNSSGTVTETEYVYWYFYPTVTAKYRHGTDYYLDITGRIAYVGGDQTTKQLRLKIYKGSELVTVNGVSELNLDSLIASSPSGTSPDYYDGYLEINRTGNNAYVIPSDYITDIATDTYEFRLTITDTVSSSTSKAYSGISVMTFGAGGTDITAHKPMNFKQGILIDDTAVTDFVVDSGTYVARNNQADCHWRKWNSGWCELHYGRSGADIAVDESYVDWVLYFPFSLTAVQSWSVGPYQNTTYSNNVGVWDAGGYTTTYITMRAHRNSGVAQPHSVSPRATINVYGYWK